MPGRVIMTVTGPLDPLDLGPTDAHEHLFLETPAQPHDTMHEVDRALAELEEGAASGLRAIVELTPIGLGRMPQFLREAAERSGMTLIGTTGYHRDAHYSAGDWVYKATVEELAGRVMLDLRNGMDGTDVKAGVIKAGASLNGPTEHERSRLRAIAMASNATGAAVIVHTEAGTGGPEIVDLLSREGVAVERITLAHMDRNPDRALHAILLDRGISFVYDTIGRDKYGPDRSRIDLIADMVKAGFGDQLMLGLDLGRRAYHRSYGGEPGLRHLMSTFVPQLRSRIGRATADKLLISNPARIYSMPA